MDNELKKLAATMRDMSDMVGDHHWQAAVAIDELQALKSKPINIGDLSPQQRLDVAQRDAEVERLQTMSDNYCALLIDANAKLAALESQQAASVGGKRDREADRAMFSDPLFNKWLDEPINDTGEFTVWNTVNAVDAWHGWFNRQFYVDQEHAAISPGECWMAGVEWARSALSPAGGGVFPAEFLEHVKHARKELCRAEQSPLRIRQKLAQTLTDWLARLNAKPQANSQEGE